MEDTSIKEESPNFNLPKEGTDERCYEEYSEEVDPKTGQLVTVKVEETKEKSHPDKQVATREGLDFTKKINGLQVKDYIDKVKTKVIYDKSGRRKTIMQAPKTAWIHNLIHLNGEKFDFTGREYLLPIYNTNDKEILLKTARQVEKSTLLANELTVMACLIPYFRNMYVSPSHVQTRTFSNDKLKPVLERSPMISRYMQDNKVSTQVFEKGFTNGSMTFLRSAFFSADRARGISSDLLCYDKDTYALTKEGWRLFKDIGWDTEFATRNPNTGRVEWHKPTEIIVKKHTGKMVTFKHQGFRLRVTDNHDMVINWAIKPYLEEKWEKVKALDLSKSKKMGFKLGNPVKWEEDTPDIKSFTKWQVTQGVGNGKRPTTKKRINTYPGLDIPYLKFAEIIGWYLSEGFMSGSGSSQRPCLTLNVTKDLDIVKKCLMGSNITYSLQKGSSEATKTLVLNSSHLKRYLKDNRGAYNKYIPREFMDHPSALERLLFGLYKGDACYHKGESWEMGTLRTRSKRLAEDSQEAWLRLGRPAVIHTRMAWNKHQDAHDYHEGELAPLYEVCSYKRDYMIFWNSDKGKRITEENVVDEEVFCVTVPNHELIVKGDFHSKPIVCGNCIDELQDMIMDNLPVIAQCLSHSKYQYHRYAGTPKSFDNTIEQYWQNTTQNEWMVPCSGCSSETGKKWNFLDIKNVGKHGPICKFCGKKLDISSGQWQSTVKSKRMRGYRIPQLMVPWIREWDGDPWKTLVHEMEIYPEAQFYNEILGLSYDNAAKPVTRADIAMNCDPNCHFLDLSKPIPDKYARGILFAGVDWGEGNDGVGKDIMGKPRNASYTVLTIGGMVGNRFQVLYIKKYQGKETDPDYVVKDIYSICKRLNVRMIGVDWGHGWGVNNRLFRMYGADKCVQFMHVDNQKEVRKWDPVGFKFQIMRNHVMSEVFFMFKEGKFLFPPIEEWEWYLKDIMNISVEYIEYQRKLRYIHRPSDPDDCFHSLLYCKQVADVYYGKR